MDDDVLRRGKPTCHVAFDVATALLVGDSLQSLAFQVLSDRPLASVSARQLEVRTLAAAAGSRDGRRAGYRSGQHRHGASACRSLNTCTSTRPAP
jgi:farnesyl diphosphate synthase